MNEFRSLPCFIRLAIILACAALLPLLGTTGAMAADTGAQAEQPFVISKGDTLEIYVWKEPDLSRPDTFVRSDGMISLPLVNEVKAAGRTPTELKAEIESKLSEYIELPVVTVILKGSNAMKYYMIGEVQSGEYDLFKDLTLIQACARAGGFTEWASEDDIVILRNEDGVEKRIRADFDAIVKGKQPNIILKPGDTIIVP